MRHSVKICNANVEKFFLLSEEELEREHSSKHKVSTRHK